MFARRCLGFQRHAPTPLFNYRKRPRQAIVSDPQQLPAKATSATAIQNYDDDRSKQSNKNTEGFSRCTSTFKQSFNASSCTYGKNMNNHASTNSFTTSSLKQSSKPGLMNMHGQFSGSGRGAVSYGGSSNENRGRGSSTINRKSEKNIVQNQGSKNNFHNSKESKRGREMNPSGLPFNFQQSVSCNSSEQNNMNRNISQPGVSSLLTQTTSTSKNCEKEVFRPSNINRGKVYPGNSFNNSKRRCGRGYGDDSKFQTNKGWANGSKTCNQGMMSIGPEMPKHYSSKSKSIFDDDDDFMTNTEFGTNHTAQNSIKDPKMNTKMVTPTAPDSSMRIFTCPISVLKSWTASKMNTCLVMFEVYGIVDSATVKDQTGTGKTFDLRDDTSSIKCIFYEIDRELPRLIRGQVHRVMATVDPKSESLKVLSVRLAEKEERQVCQLASQLSQREMEDIAKVHNEQ